jgi:hypothetical protein
MNGEVATETTSTDKPWRFNAETAKKAALLSHASRKLRKAQPIAFKPVTPDSQATFQPAMMLREVDPVRVARYDEHIARTEQALRETSEPRDVQALTQALFRLEEIRCIYAGIPKPGQRRPGRDDNRRRPVAFSSPVLEIGPAQPANTTTGSVPEQPQDTPENSLVQVVK